MPIYATGRRKDGKQQYRVRINYTDAAGAHKQKEQSCYGYKQAQDLERQMTIKYGTRQIPADLTLKEFYGQYLEIKKTEVRETTLAKISANLEDHVLPSLGAVPLNDLNERVLTQWKQSISDMGFSTAYCRRIYGEFNTMLNRALRLKFIHENPLANVGNFRETTFHAPAEKISYYTPEQFLKYASAANSAVRTYMDRSVFMFLMIAYYTGLRKGEIHALRWDDIHDDILQVNRSISQKVKGKPIVETPPKNRSSIRQLQIPLPLMEMLAQYKALQQLQFGKKWRPDFRVCYGDHCISDTTISNKNIAWAKAAGLTPLRIHDFRHSHASLLANEGINIQEVARRLGHADVHITWNLYAHLYPREEERAVAILNQLKIPELSPNDKK